MAANGLLPKFTAGFGVFLAGVVLTAAAFPTHASAGSVAPEIMRHMSLLYLPFATGMKALSVIVLVFYKIDKTTHEENIATLARAAAVGEVADIEEARPVSVGAGSGVV
jgi:Na+/melibiose symporter-like transporter